jgi:hypothetical protein
MIAFSSSGELRLEDNCFINSPVSTFTASSVVVLVNKPTIKAANNFIDVVQTDIPCPYMLDLDNDNEVQCRSDVVFNASTCASNSSFTQAPATTKAPTLPPSNTANPVVTPTAAPTAKTSAASAPHAAMSFFALSISFALTGLVTIFVCENMML